MLRRFGCLLLAVVVPLVMCASASAVVPAPGWEVTATTSPTHLEPGGKGFIGIDVFDTGAVASTPGATLSDTLPAGVTAVNQKAYGGGVWVCSGTPVTCTTSIEAVGAGERLRDPVYLEVEVEKNASEGAREGVEGNHVVLAGGGAFAPAETSDPIVLSKTPAGFGIAGWDGWFSSADGRPDAQAGSHPYEATFVLGLNTARERGVEGWPAGGEMRNVSVNLPPGFVGDPNAVPQCTRAQLDRVRLQYPCPAATQVGIAMAGVAASGILPVEPIFSVYNMVPPPGVAAQFAFSFDGVGVFLDATVRSGGGYGITEHVDNIPQRTVVNSTFTFWGEPSDPSHDPQRCEGDVVLPGYTTPGEKCGVASSAAKVPFLTLPTSCPADPATQQPEPFSTSIHMSAWENESTSEARAISHDQSGAPIGITGCEDLAFGPSLSIGPDTSAADTPAGLTVEVNPPTGGLESPEGLSSADIENTTVTLPEGFVINPGQAAGLAACRQGDVPGGDDLPLPGENGEEERFAGPPECPNASKVGTVKIKTPLLEAAPEKELEGSVYVLQSNPPELKLLIAASGDGVNLKLVLNVHLNRETGQLVSTLERSPGLPFTSFKLAFSGGAQAALDTPTQCGTYTTTSEFTPWASPFIDPVFPFSAFAIATGPSGGAGGSPCPSNPLPFSPELIAGATNPKGGAFTNFSLLLRRGDGQQRIEKLQFKAPPGLSGMLSAVPLCPEPQARAGTCSSASQIGHASVASGPGPYPLVLPQPGDPEFPIYLTGPYNGHGGCTPGEPGCAPFGLSIVTPIVAGPFDLGTIVTRAKIEVDPHTAQITVTTDPLPKVVDGVPTDLRLIDSVIERPGFMFNPTHCEPSSFSGTAWGTPPPGTLPGGTQSSGPGANAPISTPFDVVGCKGLPFKPKFKVSTSAHTSKAVGASLHVTVTYPPGALGTQAWLRSAKVELPKNLPSRLTTLQKACTAKVFETNPASCPVESVIGHAIVHTQVLPVPLEGPAYFVSHGGEAFPSLIMVLQGYGVTIDLVGATDIKNGVTSTTFKATPDTPFETFELTLPQGKYSALAANANLCKPTVTKTVKKREKVQVKGRMRSVVRKVKEQVTVPLQMPNEFIAQNGAVIKESTKITVTGCPKAKVAAKKHKKAKGKRKKK